MPNMKIIGSLAAASAAVATAAVVKKKGGEKTTEDEKKWKRAKTKDAKAKQNSGGRRWLGRCRCSD